MADDTLGAKIVITADAANARAAVQATTDDIRHIAPAAKQAEGAAADAEKSLEKLHAKKGEDAERGVENLNDRLKELGTQVPGGSAAMSAFGEVVQSVEGGPLAALGTAVAVLAGGIEGLKESVRAFEQQEAANTKLDAALSQSGQLTDEFRGKLQALSKELQEQTGVSEERWAAILARLEQFGANPKNIGEYAESIKNLAGLLGGDIERASLMFTRAMGGNTGALHRLGIEVDKNASQAQKLEEIQRQLAQRGGGQLEAQTKTLTGQFTSFGLALEDCLKGLGNSIDRTGLLQIALEDATRVLQWFGDQLPHTTERVEGLTNKLPGFEAAVRAFGKGAEEAGADMGELGEAADSARGSAEELAKSGLDALKGSLDAISEKTKTAVEGLEKLQQQQDKMDNADMALDIARIKAGPGTDEEKIRAERDVRRRYADAKEQREDDADADKIIALQSDTSQKQRVAANAQFDVRVARAKEAENVARTADAKADYNRQLPVAARAQSDLERLRDTPGPEAGVQRHEAQESLQRATLALETAKERGAALAAQGQQIAAELKAAQEKADKAVADAAESARKNAEQIGGVVREQQTRRYVAAREREQTTVESGADDRRRAEADAAKFRAQWIQTINDTLKTAPNLSEQQRVTLTQERDRLAAANAAQEHRGETPYVRRAEESNRVRVEQEADDKDTAGGAGIAGAARAISGDLAAAGAGQPGTVSGNIQDLIAKLLAHGGKDDSAIAQLLPALNQYVDAQAGVGQRNARLEADVNDLKRKIQQLTTRLKNNP